MTLRASPRMQSAPGSAPEPCELALDFDDQRDLVGSGASGRGDSRLGLLDDALQAVFLAQCFATWTGDDWNSG